MSVHNVPEDENQGTEDDKEGHDDGDSDSKEVPDIVDTDEVIEEALSVARGQSMTSSVDDEIEHDVQVRSFLAAGCGCHFNKGQPCSTNFGTEQVETCRLEANELSRGELDLVILGKLAATCRLDDTQRQYSVFLHGGHRICQKMFMYLHDIGYKRLRNLMKHLKKNGLTGRTHGNTR